MLDGRKGLLEVLEGDQVLPSYALVAVVAGHRWGVVVEGWLALVEREAVGRRVGDRDGECLWTLLNQPTILASIATHQALAYSSALLARNENLSLLLLLDPHLVHLRQHRAVSTFPV